jgi:hypothetical protein
MGEGRPRFGIGGGYHTASADLDYDDPDSEVTIGDGDGLGGFVEAVLDIGSTVDVHLRLLGQRSDLEQRGDEARSQVAQYGGLLLASTTYAIVDPLALRPLFGIGYGHVDIDTDALLALPGRSGGAFFVAGGLELEVGQHVSVGGMLQLGVFGEPFDTEGSLTSSLVYLALRF